MHYIITKGGAAPNIVPDLAGLEIIARSPSQPTLDDIWSRVLKIEQGAELMTETHITGGTANILGNDVLARIAQDNFRKVGGYRYTDDERRFATELQKSLSPESVRPLDQTETLEPWQGRDSNTMASTDVGDVSWNVPTIGLVTATFVPGVAPHTWQAAASTGMSIGQRGIVVAAKVLTLTAADLLTDPHQVQAAQAEFQRQLQGRHCRSLIPADQKPPLDSGS
jgi:aminobenzoyl-glutamate utilization protein B